MDIQGPSASGSSVITTISVLCTDMELAEVWVGGMLKAPNGNLSSNSRSCVATTTCTVTLSAPLAYGTWTVTAEGSYRDATGYVSLSPITRSATITQPQPRYWLKLLSIGCLWPQDAFSAWGADEPRLYVNGTLVWSHEHFRASNSASLTHLSRIPFSGSSLPITLKEYDAWPGSTVTFAPRPAYASINQAGTGEQAIQFTYGGSTYGLLYIVVYEV